MLRLGDLVIWEKLPRIASAGFLFVVLGAAEVDKDGRRLIRIQLAEGKPLERFNGLTPFAAPLAELSPLAAYGLRVDSLSLWRHHSDPLNWFWLTDVGAPPATTARRWGSMYGPQRSDYRARISDDDLAELIWQRRNEDMRSAAA